jgi:hypothetical protein
MRRIGWIALLCTCLASGPGWADIMSSASYAIKAGTPAAGGGSLSGTSYTLGSLSGQPLVVGAATSSGYVMQGGFYYFLRGHTELLGKRNTSLALSGTTLVAGFDGAGVWRSADGGANWTAAATQPANAHVRALAVHPSSSSTLYAISYGGGAYVSGDSGANWSACANTGLNLQGMALVIAGDGRLYAGTEGGIYTSANCASWTALNTGLTVDAQKPPLAILVDPAAGANLLAGFDGSGVFLSADGGASWTAATTQPTSLRVRALLRSASDNATIYAGSYGAGVFKSTDGGDNWAACAAQPTNLNVLSLARDAVGKFYAGTEGGVFVSADGCASWTAINTGLP